MPKPTTGRAIREPEQPDPEQMAADTLMTSAFTGVSLIVATALFGLGGGIGLYAGGHFAELGGAKVGFAIGLAVTLAVIVWALRHWADFIKGRSLNLYRGAWIGTFAALAVIVVMYYVPQLLPMYCPPGAVCEVTG